jgi:hypothetical protein
MEAEPRRWFFERAIRNLLRYPKKPAVIVLMVHPHRNMYWQTAETDMLVISQHYQLPVISTRCEMLLLLYLLRLNSELLSL